MSNTNTNTKNFEALVNAIKESNQPIAELAVILKKQLTPIKTSKLRSTDFHKVTIGDRSFQVHYDTYECTGFNRVYKYDITNEIAAASDCVVLSKDMLFEYDNLQYKLTKVVIANDTLLVEFALICDEVIIN